MEILLIIMLAPVALGIGCALLSVGNGSSQPIQLGDQQHVVLPAEGNF